MRIVARVAVWYPDVRPCSAGGMRRCETSRHPPSVHHRVHRDGDLRRRYGYTSAISGGSHRTRCRACPPFRCSGRLLHQPVRIVSSVSVDGDRLAWGSGAVHRAVAFTWVRLRYRTCRARPARRDVAAIHDHVDGVVVSGEDQSQVRALRMTSSTQWFGLGVRVSRNNGADVFQGHPRSGSPYAARRRASESSRPCACNRSRRLTAWRTTAFRFGSAGYWAGFCAHDAGGGRTMTIFLSFFFFFFFSYLLTQGSVLL